MLSPAASRSRRLRGGQQDALWRADRSGDFFPAI